MNRLILSFIPVLGMGAAMADGPADLIRRVCQGGNPPHPNVEIERLVQEAKQGSLIKDRDPQGAIDEFDALLAKTSFAFVLECPERLRRHDVDFEIAFDAASSGGTWQVNYTSTKVTLHLDPPTDFTLSFTTYLHEMMHVCQAAWRLENQRLYNDLNGKYWRPIFGEIEAFYSSLEVFVEIVSQTSEICTQSKEVTTPFEDHIKAHEVVARGIFAQEIVNVYVNVQNRYGDEAKSHIFFPTGEERYYPGNKARPGFSMKPLASALAAEVRAIGLAIDYAPRWSERDYGFDIQWKLKEAGCFEGPIDGVIGPLSLAALAQLASTRGYDVPTTKSVSALWSYVHWATKNGAACP